MYVQKVKELKSKGAYSLAVQDGSTIYLSGQLPIDLETGEMRLGTAAEEAEIILNNIEAILGTYGLDRNQILKTTVFMTNPAYWGEINDVYNRFFTKAKPARTAVVAGEIPAVGFKVEIEAIATTNTIDPTVYAE